MYPPETTLARLRDLRYVRRRRTGKRWRRNRRRKGVRHQERQRIWEEMWKKGRNSRRRTVRKEINKYRTRVDRERARTTSTNLNQRTPDREAEQTGHLSILDDHTEEAIVYITLQLDGYTRWSYCFDLIYETTIRKTLQ